MAEKRRSIRDRLEVRQAFGLARQGTGMSVRDFASAMGISQLRARRLEAGISAPNRNELNRIVDILGSEHDFDIDQETDLGPTDRVERKQADNNSTEQEETLRAPSDAIRERIDRPDEESAPGVFLSYRRDDAAGTAGRIFDRLQIGLGPNRTFMDVYSIDFGVDFSEVITRSLINCKALVVIIGNNWLGRSAGGQTRLDNPNDFVRLEIEAALRRRIRVIPVLTDGAQFPRPQELPESIRPLASFQGLTVDHVRFDSDVERLTSTLKQIIWDGPR